MGLGDIFNKYNFSGPSNRRYTDQPEQEVVVDFAEEGEKSISLSLDAYVSGQYVSRKGRAIEVMFRFNVYVRYSESTMKQAMSQVRQKILDEFKREFPGFDPSVVFVDPDKWKVPTMVRSADPESFYRGSIVWRKIVGTEYARYELATRKDIYKTSVSNIKKRYGLK